MSGFLINRGNFYFTPKHTIELAGNTSTGDFNSDGFFDIVLMGEDLAGQWHTKKYQSGIDGYTIQDVSPALKNGSPFVADFNYDGIVDISYHGTTTSGDTVNVIQYSNGADRFATTAPIGKPAIRRLSTTTVTWNCSHYIPVNSSLSTLVTLQKRKNEGPENPYQCRCIASFQSCLYVLGETSR